MRRFPTSGCVGILDNIDYQLRRVSRQRIARFRRRIQIFACKSYRPIICH